MVEAQAFAAFAWGMVTVQALILYVRTLQTGSMPVWFLVLISLWATISAGVFGVMVAWLVS